MINHGNTFTGKNGSFTSVYYKRNGEWFPGVQNNQTGKRVYGCSVRDSWCAATEAAVLAESAAGKGAKMVLKVLK